MRFDTLVDSGSSDCFVDLGFVLLYKLPVWEIASVSLILIDSTINCFVSQITMLPILLSCSYEVPIEFFITKLNESSLAVLGFSQLQSYNSLID